MPHRALFSDAAQHHSAANVDAAVSKPNVRDQREAGSSTLTHGNNLPSAEAADAFLSHVAPQ
jgi:hypothetical protein